ncbi:PilW family protein [Ureibacillus composti]
MIKKNEKGMSLIEVLAILIIFTIISLFMFSIMNLSSKQQHEQTTESLQLQDGAYILKQITKDLRKSFKVTSKTSGDSTIFYFQDQTNNSLFIYEYKNSNYELYRNNVLIGKNIKSFSIYGDQTVHLDFMLNNKNFETSITFRRGSS